MDGELILSQLPVSPIELVTRILARHRLTISVVDATCSCTDDWWLPIDHVGAIQYEAAALSGWASNKAVPVEERLQAAHVVINLRLSIRTLESSTVENLENAR